jgi:hypothetical protein
VIGWAGLPWPDQATDAVISAYRGSDGDPLARWVWSHDLNGSLNGSIAELLMRFDDASVVPAAVVGALARAASAEIRRHVADAVDELNLARRSAPPVLVPLLGPLLADPDERVRQAAASTVRAAGSAGAMVADELAALAAEFTSVAEIDRRGAAAGALCALIELGDPRWRAPLLAAWRSGHAPYDAGTLLSGANVPADPELLAAVRARLASIPAGPGLLAAVQAGLASIQGMRDYDEHTELVRLLGCWGPAAAPAIPELLVALQDGWGAAARALTAIGAAATVALPALRAAGRRGDLGAAAAVWHLAGEPDLLVEAIRSAIDRDTFHHQAIDELLSLGGHARALLPRLRQFLTGEPAPFPARDAQMAAARVVWRLTGDPDAVLPTVRAVLAAGDQPAGTAASVAAELGAHARPLLPLLRAARDDGPPWILGVDAARALWRLDRSAAGLVEPLLAAVADPWGGAAEAALDLLVEMRATQTIPRLRELAGQDARIITAGKTGEIIHEDERLGARLLKAIADLARDLG